MKNIPLVLSLAFSCLLFNADAQGKRPDTPAPSAKFSREEFMLMNLNRGQDSTGFHISVAAKQTKQMIKDLDKSLRQLEQADREFAKSKGRPDDHFLTAPKERLQQALKTAQQLDLELSTSKDELKDSIQQALIMAR